MMCCVMMHSENSDLYSCKDDIAILEDLFSLNLSTYEQDQFLKAAPLTGGMGAQLMQKMGWREGEGLGKNKNGTVEPIVVDFKTDRKGEDAHWLLLINIAESKK